jgi:hypothetical protein
MREDAPSLSGPALVELLQAIVSKGASFRFQAKGFSMSPFIKDGDVVTVSPVFRVSPGIGKVVAFKRPGTERLVIHRVIGKRKDVYLTKGDDNSAQDEPVPKTDILGCVTTVERNGRRVSLGLGPERLLIAHLNRRGFFPLVIRPMWSLLRPFLKGWFL